MGEALTSGCCSGSHSSASDPACLGRSAIGHIFKTTNFAATVRKFISSLLAMLVLLLSCLPCNDADALPSSGDRNTSISAAPVQDCSGHHSDCDLCSPFCACFCCAATALPVSLNITALPLLPEEPGPLTAYLPASLSEVLIPIWQPPQIA